MLVPEISSLTMARGRGKLWLYDRCEDDLGLAVIVAYPSSGACLLLHSVRMPCVKPDIAATYTFVHALCVDNGVCVTGGDLVT